MPKPPPPGPRRLKPVAQWLAVGLLGLGLGLVFSLTQPGAALDGAAFDGLVRASGRIVPTPNLAVILINEADYRQKATPLALWGLHLSPLLDRLSRDKPRTVGLDIVLPRFALVRFVREHDQRFFRSLKKLSRNTRLVTGYVLDPAGRPIQPFVIYQRIIGPQNYGYFNLSPDADGVVRRQKAALAGEGGRALISFAARVAGREPPAGTVIIPDWRRPAQPEILSLDRALAAPEGAFTGRTVLVGFDFRFEDRHATPRDKDLPGVLLQAQMTEALLTGRHLTDWGRWPSLLIPALMAALAGLALTAKPTARRTAVAGGLVFLGLAGLTWAALAAGLILRPSAGLLATAVILPLRLGLGLRTVRQAFGRHVTPAIRDEVLSGRLPLDGQVKEVSALFSDLRNFTPMVEATEPKEVIKILNGYFEAMSRAITAQGGTVMQYVGDEIYAVFGAPQSLADHPARAVAAGLAMRRALAEYNARLAEKGLPPLDHGIGVHSGRAVAALIGGGERVRYSLVGDTINLASRLQGLNKQFGTKFIISAQTRNRLEESIRVEELPTVPIKGKTEEVIIFNVPDQ